LKVLLTGGLGYVGGRLAEALAATTNHELTLVTRRSARGHVTVPTARIVTIDWTSDLCLARACEGMDVVVHLAGMNAADCARDPVAALVFNGVGTARLVQAAAKQGVSRFVYLSTAHVYGSALQGCVDELTCPQPRHAYATSHRAGEDAVRSARDASHMDGVVVRLSNAFGAPVHADVDCWSLVMNDLCRQAVTTHRAVLRSAGDQHRDFIPLSEACRAIVHLLTVPTSGLGDGLFNLGSGWAPTLRELAELIASRVETIVGLRPQLEYGVANATAHCARFDYRAGRLFATGFSPRREAVIEELDQLITFCVQHHPGVQT
jgi:UDP-glucose 4-epimerase